MYNLSSLHQAIIIIEDNLDDDNLLSLTDLHAKNKRCYRRQARKIHRLHDTMIMERTLLLSLPSSYPSPTLTPPLSMTTPTRKHTPNTVSIPNPPLATSLTIWRSIVAKCYIFWITARLLQRLRWM